MARARTGRAYCYLAGPCPYCGDDGQLRFWRCAGGRVVVACHDCWAVFPSPGSLEARDALDLGPGPAFRSPALGCDVGGPDAGWATRAEVEAAGWGGVIAGEGRDGA